MKDEALTIFRRRKIGFIFQNYNLVPVLNVYENMILPIQLDGAQPDSAYIQQIVQTLGLESKLQSLPNNLSGGQQQRVAIARAIAAHPPVILADEPTGSLDRSAAEDCLALLGDLNRLGHTVILITHDAASAARADRILTIEDGVLRTGT